MGLEHDSAGEAGEQAGEGVEKHGEGVEKDEEGEKDKEGEKDEQGEKEGDGEDNSSIRGKLKDGEVGSSGTSMSFPGLSTRLRLTLLMG